MRSLHPFFLLVFIVFCGFSSIAAVPNDTPCSATSLGLLDTATTCPFSTGGTPLSIFNQSNAFANAEPMQPSLMNCQGIGNMPAQSKDCWYKFRVRAHSLKVILFGNINTPYIALYQYTGNCMSMVPVDCAKGSSGYINTDFNALVPGSEYYLQVTGSSLSDVGSFDLVISNTENCLSCTQDAALFVDHAPVNGYYSANDSVSFCYVVNGYKRKNNNSLHGVVPVMGPGWNSNVAYLPVVHSTIVIGTWLSGYMYNGLPFSLGNKKGFFFDDAINDGIPENNLGDSGGISDRWIFCWKAVTNACPSAANLNITVYTFSDGQTGTGQGPGCIADDPYHFAAVLNCCGAIQVQESTTACATLCTGGAMVQINPNTTSFPPLYYYAWFDQAGTVINTSIPSIPQYGDTLTGLCKGDYSVVVTNTAQNCFLAEAFEIKTAFTIDPKQLTFSCGTTGGVSATVNAVPNTNVYTYSWSNGNTNQTATNLISGQTYTVFVTANGCTLSEVITMEPIPFSDPFFMYPSTNIVKCTGSPQFVFPFYIATPGGTFSCGTPGVVDPNTGAINVFNTTLSSSYQITYTSPAPCQGSYIVTITIVGADPAYFHYTVDVVCATRLDPLIPDSVASYGGTFTSSPFGLTIDSISGIIYPPFIQGTYTITYTSPGQGSCQNVFTDTIEVHPVPAAPQGPSNGYTYCPGDPTVSMTATLTPACPSCVITWFSDIQFTNLVATGPTYTAPTNQQTPIFFYLVAYDILTGCVGAPSIIQVTMAAYPNVVTTTTDSVVCPGVDGFLHAVPNTINYQYSWAPSIGLNDPTIADPMFNINTTTTFTVFVTDVTTGCNSSCVHTIVVDSTRNCDSLIFYQGLTPNGDDRNDKWTIDGINKYPKNRVSIFTRWGEKVWETNDYDNRINVWEGNNQKGKPLVAGTYYYVVEVPDMPAQKGWVELSR